MQDMRTALLALAMMATAAPVAAQTLVPNDRDHGEAGGWKVYANRQIAGCFTEQKQGDTVYLLGIFGKENHFALGLRNDSFHFAKNGESYQLKLIFDGKTSWDIGTFGRDLGQGILLFGAYADAGKLRAQFAKASSAVVRRGNQQLARMALKGTTAALKAVDACRAAEPAPSLAGVGSSDAAALAEASRLDSEALTAAKTGDLIRAETLSRRALAIKEKALGSEHPLVAANLNAIAASLFQKGDVAGAEPLYRRSLAIREKTLGPEHPDVADSLNILANLLSKRGDLTGAEPLYRRALAIREKALGPDHPTVGNSLNSLANLLYAKGDLAGAESLYRRALAIREKALGPEHANVGDSLNNLANIFMAKGDLT